jgi:hypothetical protein
LSTITLKLNGKPFDPHPLTPNVATVLAFLEKAPDAEIFDRDALAQHTKIRAGFMKDYCIGEPFTPFTVVVRGRRYWGSRKAIAELRRQVGQ